MSGLLPVNSTAKPEEMFARFRGRPLAALGGNEVGMDPGHWLDIQRVAGVLRQKIAMLIGGAKAQLGFGVPAKQ